MVVLVSPGAGGAWFLEVHAGHPSDTGPLPGTVT